VGAREELLAVDQTLRHGDQVVLDIGEVQALSTPQDQSLAEREQGRTHDIRLGSHAPVLVATFRQALYYVRLGTHEPQQTQYGDTRKWNYQSDPISEHMPHPNLKVSRNRTHRQRPPAEDDDIVLDRLEVDRTARVLVKAAKRDQIIVLGQLDLLMRLLHLDVLGGERVDCNVSGRGELEREE
jgi:hypothetical protein